MYSGRLFYFCSMKHLLLFDDPAIRGSLLPFTFTRPIADLRVGILKVSEKWEKYSGAEVSYWTQEYLQNLFPRGEQPGIAINGSWLPDTNSWQQVTALKENEALFFGKTLLATACGGQEKSFAFASEKKIIQAVHEPILLQKTWHIFQFNAAEIRKDFILLTAGRNSQPIKDPHTRCYGEDQIFIEEGVQIRAAILNAEGGPIYLGKIQKYKRELLFEGLSHFVKVPR